ncbi:MAG: hypothetical protein GXO30_06040 [Epsilonproteobacteria bacterium]|nr:hypothetical protein [Campylobacterota bacterium]
MKIASNIPNITTKESQSPIKTDFTQKISQKEASEIREQISKRANEMMINSATSQVSILNKDDKFQTNYQDFKNFLSDIGYTGKPIAELSQDEAAELISEDGIFGIKQTSERIANFVINTSNGDEKLMRAGREGMLQGFQEAEAMWGGELPEISQKTMQAAVEMVDKAMYDLGYSIIDQEA